MKKTVLITGGSGLIGKCLTEKLQKKGYAVTWLSRKAGDEPVKKYAWDYASQNIDVNALKEADYIIHLAGASVFEKRWSEPFKKEIIDSRVETTKLLINKLREVPNKVKAVVCASAIGYYGYDTGEVLQSEDSPKGHGFLAEATALWEEATKQFETLNIRTTLLRVGIVFSDKGGALEELAKPIRLYAGAALGSGNQYIPWIHVEDVCNLFIKAIEEESMHGIYNAVAPQSETNKKITELIAKVLNKPLLLPNVPSSVLKLMLGSEKALLIIGGNKVSANKVLGTGFTYQFENLEDALKNLLLK